MHQPVEFYSDLHITLTNSLRNNLFHDLLTLKYVIFSAR